ncbi:hypothetical protein NX059_002941 [Plenodomus lindquistii]|nr:hypothetical protein NX059_002941 [Plenodomus lindquistii]
MVDLEGENPSISRSAIESPHTIHQNEDLSSDSEDTSDNSSLSDQSEPFRGKFTDAAKQEWDVRNVLLHPQQRPPRADACARCVNIRWDRLVTLKIPVEPPWHRWRLLRVHESSDTLSASSCTFCNLLASGKPFGASSVGRLVNICSLSGLASGTALRSRILNSPYLEFRNQNSADSCETLVKRRFMLEPSQPDGDQIRPRRILPGEIDYALLKSWFNVCTKTHKSACQIAAVTVPGLRVIDCETNSIIDAPQTGTDYVALSYVWGAASSSNPDIWPNTILDAITVTLALGFRYLWVDRHCIDQGNEAMKHTQVRMMDQIYSQSQLTIIAVAGDNAQYGLPGVSTRLRRMQGQYRATDKTSLVEIFSPDQDLSSSTWASRAWTYQEGFLPPRRLVFTDNEVFYRCQESTFQETVCYGSGQAKSWSYIQHLLPKGKSTMNITTILETFCHRSLTYEGDALNACLGILNALAKYHWWGMPINVAENETYHGLRLNWYHEHSPGQRREGFPSWSWASTKGPKSFPVVPTVTAFTAHVLLADGSWLSIDRFTDGDPATLYFSNKHTLLCTGILLAPRWLDKHPFAYVGPHRIDQRVTIYAMLRLTNKARILCKTWLDCDNIAFKDLHNAVAFVLNKGPAQVRLWKFLILLPDGENYTRVGYASYQDTLYTETRGLVEQENSTPLWEDESNERTFIIH